MSKTSTFMLAVALCGMAMAAQAGRRYNFNSEWTMGRQHKAVTLPRAFNEDEAFRVSSYEMSDSTVWYRKTFTLPESAAGRRVVIEFEGARQMAEVFVNSKRAGMSENGVMAFGFDITDLVKPGRNSIEVKTDNSWTYREQATGTRFQWNAKSFNANYGGLPKNVWLHLLAPVHQTLPLYSSLGTTGTYIYARQFDIPGRTATIHAESQVRNTTSRPFTAAYQVIVEQPDGREVARFGSQAVTIAPGATATVSAERRVGGLHFWSWGYGYLYNVKTIFGTDTVTTATGFRKTEYRQGMIFLNDRVMQVHGYAQRSTNEWPGVGQAVPAWLSDYSNSLLVESGGNLVRWMHVMPWIQDIESCNRVGLPQAVPAGDAEKDAIGRQWQQRLELMRDVIIYTRNSPSIIFYECGNRRISNQHMIEMKALRNRFDPHGGRAIGCREMLDNQEAEYGGEMLYVNKSATKPMWMMEYCRDEGHRLYWNSWSYPYHKEGDGPLHRGHQSKEYNHNADEFAAELVRRWHEYWQERPGTGTKSNAGGVKIIFSDTQTHGRSADNYRVSGVVDAMRIPKDAFYAHQVMWDGWVDDLRPRTHIVGHWNYTPGQRIPTVYVVSNADSVALMQGGRVVPQAARSSRFLFIYKDVEYSADKLMAVGYDKQGREVSRHELATAGRPHRLRLTPMCHPAGWRADGADVALVQVEVVDSLGRRCPLDNSTVSFRLKGRAEWLGGIAMNKPFGTVTNQLALNTKTIDDEVGADAYGNKALLGRNHAGCDTLPVECGVNRVMLRSLPKAGRVTLTATVAGLPRAEIELHTLPVAVEGGLSRVFPADGLPCVLTRGETPSAPSFVQTMVEVPIIGAVAGSGQGVEQSYDGYESTSWSSRGRIDSAWVSYTLAETAAISQVCIKMHGFRTTSYPVAVYAGEEKVYEGITPKGLGYVRLPLKPHAPGNVYTIRLTGMSQYKDAFAGVKELDSSFDEKIGRPSRQLKIIEVEMLKRVE